MELTFEQDRDERGEHLRVDGHKCGHDFVGIARIYEPDSPNPMMLVERPLGFGAVAQIMEAVSNLKLNQ
jgi:hypothetical protein